MFNAVLGKLYRLMQGLLYPAFLGAYLFELSRLLSTGWPDISTPANQLRFSLELFMGAYFCAMYVENDVREVTHLYWPTFVNQVVDISCMFVAFVTLMGKGPLWLPIIFLTFPLLMTILWRWWVGRPTFTFLFCLAAAAIIPFLQIAIQPWWVSLVLFATFVAFVLLGNEGNNAGAALFLIAVAALVIPWAFKEGWIHLNENSDYLPKHVRWSFVAWLSLIVYVGFAILREWLGTPLTGSRCYISGQYVAERLVVNGEQRINSGNDVATGTVEQKIQWRLMDPASRWWK
jgi:hypothetical protein